MLKRFAQILTVLVIILALALLSFPKQFEGIYVSGDFPGRKFHFYKDGSFLADRSGYYDLRQEGESVFLYLTDMSEKDGQPEYHDTFIYYVQPKADEIKLLPFSSYYLEGNGSDTALSLKLIQGEDGLQDPSGVFSAAYRIDSDDGTDTSIAFFKDGTFTEWIGGYYKTAGRQTTLFLSGQDYRVSMDPKAQSFFVMPQPTGPETSH